MCGETMRQLGRRLVGGGVLMSLHGSRERKTRPSQSGRLCCNKSTHGTVYETVEVQT